MDGINVSRKRQRTGDAIVIKAEPLPNDTLPTLKAQDHDDGNVIIKTYTHFSRAEAIILYRTGRIVADSLDEALNAIPPNGLDGLVQYKVHRSILVSHSNVFADYFSGKETILNDHVEQGDGVTVFTVEDQRLDLDEFFRVIYTPYSRYLSDAAAKCDKITMLGILSRILNATERFDSRSIRETVDSYIQRLYPARLSSWDRDKFNSLSPPVTALTIRLGIDHKIGSILPIFLYHLSTTLGVFDGFASPDHQVDFDTVLATLTARETRILYGGSSTLYSQNNFRMAALAALEGYSSCKRSSPPGVPECTEIFAGIVRPSFALPSSPASAYRTRFPLDRFDQIESVVATHNDICPTCQKDFVQRTREAKLQLWKDLPRIFNVVDLAGKGWGSE
ncbi:unnamed protein product [Peniophora sp. CBMAI 1063]|nr:unnamed protein product [Peniophora sp. CBMAI 1063]